MMTEYEFAKNYYSLRGIYVQIDCTKCISAGELDSVHLPKGEPVSMKILQAGAAAFDDSHEIYPENDECAYRFLASPFPEDPSPLAGWGFHRTTEGDLWIGHHSHIVIKHPLLYDSGLKLVLEIPEKLLAGNSRPELIISCDGKEVVRETLKKSGVFTRIIPIDNLNRDKIEYLFDARRQLMILLDEIERVCSKYQLNYYLICGGLIGIVRTGSMIPWDDDLDIAMTREDYEKFLEAVKKEWKEGGDFLLLTPDSYGKEVFYDYMTRAVYMKESTKGDAFERLLGQGRADIHHHMPADIYILDKTPDSRLGHFLQTKKILLLYTLAMGHRGFFQPSERVKNSKAKLFLARVIGKIGAKIPLSWLLKRYNLEAARYRNKKCRDLFQSNGYYICIPMRFPESWFGKGKSVPVDGRKIRIPADPEAFLQRMYGDFRKYPYFTFREPAHLS